MSNTNAYFPVYGTGYVKLGGSRSSVAYKFVLHRETLAGGGFLLGLSEEDSMKAAELGAIELAVGINKHLSLVVGRYDGDRLPAIALGLTDTSDARVE
jgi:hypothetical protein